MPETDHEAKPWKLLRIGGLDVDLSGPDPHLEAIAATCPARANGISGRGITTGTPMALDLAATS